MTSLQTPPHLTPLPGTLIELAQKLVFLNYRLCTAESCTGGLIAAHCTSLPGSSRWFDRAFVTYSNAAKTEMLGVPEDLILLHGAVSEPVVRSMALNACQRASTQCGIAVSGVAGPDGGSPDKPVGTVWLAVCLSGAVRSQRYQFTGTREDVRTATVVMALQELLVSLRQIQGGISVNTTRFANKKGPL